MEKRGKRIGYGWREERREWDRGEEKREKNGIGVERRGKRMG